MVAMNPLESKESIKFFSCGKQFHLLLLTSQSIHALGVYAPPQNSGANCLGDQSMKNSIFISAGVLALSLSAVSDAALAASFNAQGQVVYDWDLTCSIDDCPDEWAAYEKDFNKWVRKYGGNAGRESDWKKVRDMARKSPGCVVEPQQGTDHWRVYTTKLTGAKVGKATAMVTYFSANSTKTQDVGRKIASGVIMRVCGYVAGAAGRPGIQVGGE